MGKVGHDVFFGVHANCPNFVPFKRKKERNKGKRNKENMRMYKIKKRKQKRNKRRGWIVLPLSQTDMQSLC